MPAMHPSREHYKMSWKWPTPPHGVLDHSFSMPSEYVYKGQPNPCTRNCLDRTVLAQFETNDFGDRAGHLNMLLL